MYTSLRDRPRPADAASGGAAPPVADREVSGGSGDGSGNVVALGFTSLFTDVSSEMVNAVLPLYLMTQLGFTPLAFGMFDGVYQGMSAVLRVVSGVLADRHQRYKEVAGVGYLLSAACKIGLLFAASALAVTGFLLADRTGKGIRTAPRDALIAHSSPPGRMAESFGIHRALDTVGALAGPLVAFALLGIAPGAYDAVFVVSFCVAVVGIAILGCFVHNRTAPPAQTGVTQVGIPELSNAESAWGLLRLPGFRRLTAAGGLLGLVTVSDAFLYLVLARTTGMRAAAFPLLFVGTALAYLLLAIPAGRLADRVGTAPVFLGGYALLAGCYLMLVTAGRPASFASVAVILGLLGAYYASTDGVLAAMASSAVPPGLRASGLALLTSVTALVRIVASVAFGIAWTQRGPAGAVTVFLVALAVVLPCAAWLLKSMLKTQKASVPS